MKILENHDDEKLLVKTKEIRMNITIRNEMEKDFREVEELTRETFWNLYFPGCNEHYLVHKMRNHPDFLNELDFVAEYDGKIVGNIMYTKAWLIYENSQEMEIVSFGPECSSRASTQGHWQCVDKAYKRYCYKKRDTRDRNIG